MLFAVLVVEGDVLLQAVGDQPVGDRQPALVGRQQNVQNIEQLARIAAREAEQRLRFAHVDPPLAQFGVGGDRTVEKPLQLGVLHRSQDVDLAAAQQRRNHLERRVFGRGAHERHDTLLDGTQQRILLRLVETVDFVDEQDRRRRVEEVLLAGRFDHFAHILDPRRNGRQREEGAFELRGHDLSQRGLPHPRRPPEDERRDVARLQKLAENAVAAHQMLLPDVVVERAGTEAFGQRNRHKLTVEQSNVRFFHGTAKRMPETCGRHLAQNRKSLCAKRTTNPHREKSGKRNGDGSAVKKRGRELVRAAFWAKPETAPRFFTLSDAFGATFWHQKAVEHATSEFPKREFPRFPIVHIFFVLLACPESTKRSSTANYLRHSVP